MSGRLSRLGSWKPHTDVLVGPLLLQLLMERRLTDGCTPAEEAGNKIPRQQRNSRSTSRSYKFQSTACQPRLELMEEAAQEASLLQPSHKRSSHLSAGGAM